MASISFCCLSINFAFNRRFKSLGCRNHNFRGKKIKITENDYNFT